MGSIKTQSKQFRSKQMPWPSKKRALAVAVASALSVSPALAQDEDENVEELVVTGIRQNLMNAQDLKYNADTVMESITADDLGSFPDKSIAEALQRVAGVTVNRFAASDDTAHFSAEPSGVIVRGLDQVRTEFNGRDSFSANSSRGLSWGDVSPELMSGVDTYKNQMAELIEGGIAGSVNMRTRLPFDQEGQMFAVSADANYGDLSEESTPEVSALYSNRWDLSGGGEIGMMANIAYSEVNTRTEGIQLYRMNRFRDVYTDGNGDVIPLAFVPQGVTYRDNLYDRERNGASLAFQWADAEDKLQFTTQFNRSEYENAWEEYLVQASPADLSFEQSVFYEISGPNQNPAAPTENTSAPVPAPGTDPFTFDDRGLFQTGVVTTGTGWWGAMDPLNEDGQPLATPCYSWSCPQGGPQLRAIEANTATRSNNNRNITEDLSFNFKWVLSDTVRSNFDLQFVDSTVENYDIEVGFNTFANTAIDMTGEHPRMALLDPLNFNLSEGNYANPNNYYVHHIMDHVEDSEGQQTAFRTDFEFDIGSGWMESVKVGARFADRDQEVRWSTYNWQNVSNSWTGGQAAFFNLDQHDAANGAGGQPGFTGYPEGHYTVRSFNNDFYGGGLLTPNAYVFADMGLLQNQQMMASSMGATGLGFTGGTGWDPICSNVGDRASEIPGTCFTPGEITDVSEETQALYAQLNFGGADAELFGVPVSGNLGVRFVKTKDVSAGAIAYPLISPQDLDASSTDDGDPTTQDPPVPFNVGFYISQSDKDFMNDADFLNTASVEHDNVLPSFNIKFELTEELLVRFAASRAMARPDIGNLRNYVGIGYSVPSVDDINDPLWIKDPTMDPNDPASIIGADVRYTADAHNPYLKPIIADQYDLTFEYYFADVGSFTVALFDKNFDDYIQFGVQNLELTNNGETHTVEVRRPLNGEGASINGYEMAYQAFFDFLPAPFDSFGVQLNYTHINNEGIENTNTTSVGDGTIVSDAAPDSVEVNRLEGLSDDSYTFILMYDSETIEARLAYSWRSEYMVTAIDCCVVYPIWNEDYGQVDGSFAWHLNDNFELHLQGSNLTNSETVLRQQVTNASDGGLLLPNAWFQNDRRYTLGFRYRY